MGFDPRQWSSDSQPRQRQRVTSNVEALLAENDALRRHALHGQDLGHAVHGGKHKHCTKQHYDRQRWSVRAVNAYDLM